MQSTNATKPCLAFQQAARRERADAAHPRDPRPFGVHGELGQRVKRRFIGNRFFSNSLPLHLCVGHVHASTWAMLVTIFRSAVVPTDPAHRVLRLPGRKHGAPAG